MAIRRAIILNQGKDHTINVSATDANGADIDFTGHSLTFTLATSAGGSPALTLTTAGGAITVSTTTATVTIADTDLTFNGRYYWEMAGVDGAGKEYQIVEPSVCTIVPSNITS